jgi:hypothetical protein
MKKMHLIGVGILLSTALVGCNTADRAKEIIQHVRTLKEKGCDALSAPTKKLLVTVIKARIEDYPENGICNPVWVQDVLLEKLDLQGGSDVQNKFAELGYKTNPGSGSMDQSSRAGLFLADITATSESPAWLRNRFSIYSQDGKMVYSSIVTSDQSSGSYS